MPAISATAPGKIILFGEHAVVYGYPAIAVPVLGVRAKAIIMARPLAPQGSVLIDAPDIGLKTTLEELPPEHAFSRLFTALQEHLYIDHFPAFHLRVMSTIPIASGMGSGAASSVAILRAVGTFLGRPLTDEEVSQLAYESEKAYHGTPSGIDNTVVGYTKPVWFVRGQPVEFFSIAAPFTLVIANSGIHASTADVVGAVCRSHEVDPEHVDAIFAQIGSIAEEGANALQSGDIAALGPLMLENHQLLYQLDVSLPELDHLIEAAMNAGALGAKLSGAGRGGNVIALVHPEDAQSVAETLLDNGATETIITHITPTEPPSC
jgi:mevalonate kinase